MKRVTRVKKVRAKKKFDVLFPLHSLKVPSVESVPIQKDETGLMLRDSLTSLGPISQVNSREGRCEKWINYIFT